MIEDLSKTSKRFETKIFLRSLKEFMKKLYEDLLKKINVNLLKIFIRKSSDSNLFTIFSSKNLRSAFRRNSAKIIRRIRSREDLREISSFRRSQKRFGSWAVGQNIYSSAQDFIPRTLPF